MVQELVDLWTVECSAADAWGCPRDALRAKSSTVALQAVWGTSAVWEVLIGMVPPRVMSLYAGLGSHTCCTWTCPTGQVLGADLVSGLRVMLGQYHQLTCIIHTC